MLKTWERIDNESANKLPAAVLDKVSGGVNADDDDDDPFQWYWRAWYNRPECGQYLIAYAPNDEIEYLFCGCGFDDRY